MSARRWSAAAGVGVVAIVAWIVATSLPFPPPPGSDIHLYAEVAARMADGQMPYRDFFLEYPPGAAVVIGLTYLIPLSYPTAFSLVMASALVVTALAAMGVARALGAGRAREIGVGLLVAATPLALGRYLVEERFDLLVSATIGLMLLFAVRRRFGWAWAMLGVAILIKLVPVLLVPVLLIWQWRVRRHTVGRDVAIGAGVVVAGLAPFVALAPRGLWDLAHYHLVRPLQVESLGGSYLRLIGALSDRDLPTTFSYGSHNFTGGGAGVVAGITTALQFAGIVLIALICLRSRSTADAIYVRGIAATLVLVVVTAKVLSPQFVLWIVPAALLITGAYASFAAATSIAVLIVTQLEYPYSYSSVVAGEPSGVGLLVVRNLLLVMLVAACWPRRDQPSTSKDAMATARPSGPASITAP